MVFFVDHGLDYHCGAHVHAEQVILRYYHMLLLQAVEYWFCAVHFHDKLLACSRRGAYGAQDEQGAGNVFHLNFIRGGEIFVYELSCGNISYI